MQGWLSESLERVVEIFLQVVVNILEKSVGTLEKLGTFESVVRIFWMV